MFKRKRKEQYLNSYFKPATSMKVNDIIKQAIPNAPRNSGISDSEGLSKAYSSPNSIFVDGNRMYIAGTHTARDVWDWGKIPAGKVALSERYGQAMFALKDNPQVDTIIGHSLGSSVAAELNKQNDNKFNARFYGAPFIDFSFSRDPKNQRYRHPGDFISMFDTGAVNEDQQSNYELIWPHSTSGFPDDHNDDDKPDN
jgi:hypothetical protein